jgi:hypothetical protein
MFQSKQEQSFSHDVLLLREAVIQYPPPILQMEYALSQRLPL